MLVQMKRRRSRSGFTLVEVMTTMALLLIGMVAILAAIAQSAQTNQLARDRNKAVNEARAMMERVFQDLPGNVDNYNDPEFDYEFSEIAGPDGESAQVETTVTEVDDNANLREVTVRVTWIPGADPVTLTAFRRTQ